MSEHKSIFRKAFDAMVDARAREAQRYVEQYQRAHAVTGKERFTGR